MKNSEVESLIMQIIMNSGNAKSLAMEAIKSARKGNVKRAKDMITEANEAVTLAHESQTNLLTLEARGEEFRFSLLLTHSQDHLMNSITTIDFAKELITLWETCKKEAGE